MQEGFWEVILVGEGGCKTVRKGILVEEGRCETERGTVHREEALTSPLPLGSWEALENCRVPLGVL